MRTVRGIKMPFLFFNINSFGIKSGTIRTNKRWTQDPTEKNVKNDSKLEKETAARALFSLKECYRIEFQCQPSGQLNNFTMFFLNLSYIICNDFFSSLEQNVVLNLKYTYLI